MIDELDGWRDKLAYWSIMTLWFLGAIGVFVAVMYAVYRSPDVIDYFTKEQVACSELRTELAADNRCEMSADCTFTRDELKAAHSQKALYKNECLIN